MSFPLPGYDKKLLNITNIEITNKPSGYTITADTRQIRGVAIVGPLRYCESDRSRFCGRNRHE